MTNEKLVLRCHEQHRQGRLTPARPETVSQLVANAKGLGEPRDQLFSSRGFSARKLRRAEHEQDESGKASLFRNFTYFAIW